MQGVCSGGYVQGGACRGYVQGVCAGGMQWRVCAGGMQWGGDLKLKLAHNNTVIITKVLSLVSTPPTYNLASAKLFCGCFTDH